MPAINDLLDMTTPIVLQERVTTNEYRIIDINESILGRHVHVEVEFGPFTTETFPDGNTEVRGTSRRGIRVWSGPQYDAIRDTWANSDLLIAVNSIINQ